jgi:predicted acetyltransferase
MEQLIFALPAPELADEAMNYRREFFSVGEFWIHGSGGLAGFQNYDEWLAKIYSPPQSTNAEYVPATTFFAVAGNRIIGSIQIRHVLNEALKEDGGHIGYGVRPSERRKGYATKMLALALEKCRELGIGKALVTCDRGNIASARTIMRNGGILEDERTGQDGSITQRYWITLE